MNLLLLAKASALVGAFVAGGYLGSALHFVGRSRCPIFRAKGSFGRLVAAVTGVAIVISGLLLERACRVPKEPDD